MLEWLKHRIARFMQYQAEVGSRGPEVIARLDAQSAIVRSMIERLEAGRTPEAPSREAGADSYSQCGEDRIVHFIARVSGLGPKLRYADVGAANAVWDNNTYLSYTEGGVGLLVEADADYLQGYVKYRPRDAVEQIAVVPSRLAGQGEIEFFAMEDRGWSSISAEHSARAERLGKGGVRRRDRIKCDTLNAVLGRHFDGTLDLLSLDVEGVDRELLEELDYDRFAPSIIVVENDGSDLAAGRPGAATAELMAARDYVLFGYTFVNSIYVRRNVVAASKF